MTNISRHIQRMIAAGVAVTAICRHRRDIDHAGQGSRLRFDHQPLGSHSGPLKPRYPERTCRDQLEAPRPRWCTPLWSSEDRSLPHTHWRRLAVPGETEREPLPHLTPPFPPPTSRWRVRPFSHPSLFWQSLATEPVHNPVEDHGTEQDCESCEDALTDRRILHGFEDCLSYQTIDASRARYTSQKKL